jgi:hypothetical protein
VIILSFTNSPCTTVVEHAVLPADLRVMALCWGHGPDHAVRTEGVQGCAQEGGVLNTAGRPVDGWMEEMFHHCSQVCKEYKKTFLPW